MKESSIVTGILRYLKNTPHCYTWKEHGGTYGHAGLPDIICCIDGRFVAFEVKTPAGKLSPLQQATLEKIRAAGGIAEKVISVDEVKEVLVKNELI